MLESNFIKVADLICCNFIKKRLKHRCFPVKFFWTSFFTEHIQWLLLRLSGRLMLCELNWYVETPAQLFSCKICEIFENIIDHLRWLPLFVTRCKTSKYTMTATCKGLMVCQLYDKHSQRGNRFLPITEAYLEPSEKSTMKLFCKNS